MTGTVTHALAERHEALVTRVDALIKQIEPIARKTPADAVPPAVAARAEGLLFEAIPFAPHGELGRTTGPKKRSGFPAAAGTWAALALQVAELRATLETYETAHALWDPKLQCLVWRTGRGDPLPVARHRHALMVNPNHAKAPPPTAAESAETQGMRRKVQDRIDDLMVEAYRRGFSDAAEGRPAKPYPVTLAGRIEQLNNG